MATPRIRAELFFGARCGRAPQATAFAPGRLVLLGEHLDHQGGQVLCVPLRRGVAVSYGVRPDDYISIWSMNAKEKDRFRFGEWVKTGRRWSDLAKGACAHVANTRRLPGLDLVVYGNLPIQAGLASSGAYLTAVFEAIYGALGVARPPADLARDVATVEREWGGVACGPVDPYVAAVGETGEVLHVDCAALTHEVLPLPDSVDVEDEDTGIARALSATPYNQRRDELARALTLVQQARPEVARLVDLDADALAALALPTPEDRRARHVVTEARRVADGVRALQDGDMPWLGHLLLEGHRSLSADFESSLPEIDDRVEALCAQDDVHGARLQGAGFGGRIVVLREAGD